MEDMRGLIDPEHHAAAVAALARAWRLGFLPDAAVLRAYRDGGAPLDNDLVVNAIVVTLRLLRERADDAARVAGKDPDAQLLRSVAVHLIGDACDQVATEVIHANARMARAATNIARDFRP